ncbi:hypothetical protein SAMN05192574_103564 [Mucilaginibacter gossypiicola]|uniref:DUF3945 domain-containing protein n=1 Tax=Mucilaginibacter gossypiicola TaxID=551995 RepID=A0A1H8HN28_9SPHI|nr:hypothetical protein [Mucilaginibacter gossypiicola]SEN57377.1 hypothetical protein SAMN05192574_103564 [Mucilaginibacter gossypiicola]
MNENNVAYLAKQVKYTGFGDSLEHKIMENVAEGKQDFKLNFKPEFGEGRAEATLHFRRSDQGNYFFNKYDLQVTPEGKEPLTQSFNVKPSKPATIRDEEKKIVLDGEGKPKTELLNNSFTLKEAFNMMDVNAKGEGRAVLKDFVTKEGEKETLWNKLDFTSRDQYGNYPIKTFFNYSLEAKLSQFPIKELSTPDGKKQLLDSLERGNRQAVTMTLPNGTEYKRSIEANPQFKTINMFDGNQRVKHQSIKQEGDKSATQSEGKNQGAKAANKNSATADMDNGPTMAVKKQSAKRKSQGVS